MVRRLTTSAVSRRSPLSLSGKSDPLGHFAKRTPFPPTLSQLRTDHLKFNALRSTFGRRTINLLLKKLIADDKSQVQSIVKNVDKNYVHIRCKLEELDTDERFERFDRLLLN